MSSRRFLLTAFILLALLAVVVTTTAEDGAKFKAKTYSAEQIEAIKATLADKIAPAQRVELTHDSDPLRGQLEPSALGNTANIVVDDGSPGFLTLFNGTTPTYFWGNTFTNPGTGTFTVASVTPFVNAAGRADTFFCTSATQFRGDGIANIAVVDPIAGAPALGTATGAIAASGFTVVPVAAPGPSGTGQSFVAGHLVDAVDCGGGTSTTNHFGEFSFFDRTTTGGGSGTGLSNAFLPGAFTSPGFGGASPSRTVFTRATIIGPNVPVELTTFSVE